MNKEIKYTGYTSVPSDYECADGQLAHSLNLLIAKGSLAPVLPPKTVMSFDKGTEVAFIHKTTAFTHYIVHTSDGTLQWTDSSEKKLNTLRKNGDMSFSHINAVGNTLLVFNKYEVVYYLWKNGTYKELGNKLPEIAISFGLVGHPRLYSLANEDDNSTKKRGTFKISFNSIGKEDLHNTFSDENKSKITSQVMAKVNKFIAEQTINKGRFCFPFFVRWAYRLFDGSHMMHSAPILMTPSTTPAPIVFWKRATGNGSYTDAECDIMMVATDIDYSLTRYGDYNDLINDWQDIISGIDIFISKPIYTYDQNGEFTSFSDDDNFECKFIGRLYNGEKDKDTPDTTLASDITEDRMLAPMANTDFISKYMEYSYSHIYSMYFSKDRTVPNTSLHMPEDSDDKRDENVESNANFYKLTSIDINELEAGTRKTISIKDDYLQSLVTREVMADDYLTHDRLMAESSYNFNSRLNLSGVTRELFNGFISNALFPYCQDIYSFNVYTTTKAIAIGAGLFSSGEMRMRVYIRENGEVYYVENEPGYYVPYLRFFVDTSNWTLTTNISDGTRRVTTYDFEAGTKTVKIYDCSGNLTSSETFYNSYKPTAWASWLFYPNANAFKIAIYQYSKLVFECDLKAHEYINGAYAFLGFKSQRGNSSTVGTLPTVTRNDENVEMPNKIYTSEVNNPFFFPVLGINTVGTGKVFGMSSANKALSQGQFPLYAFTDEGVGALEVSSTGTYSAKQPITRDVCINPDSITQLDTAVLFATDRGVMLISGSQTQCLTDVLDSEAFFDIAALPGLEKQFIDGPTKIDGTFSDYIKQVQMTYDYINQRILLYNPTKPYAYVYSMHSKQWGIMKSQLTASVNAYPDALAMASDGENSNLVDVAHSDETSASCLLVTRPLKLDAPDIYKAIDTAIQRGYFRKGHVQTILYGSRDLFKWHLVWSSKDHFLRGFRGTPYKYFRIALLCNLDADESINGATVQFTPRLTNNPK